MSTALSPATLAASAAQSAAMVRSASGQSQASSKTPAVSGSGVFCREQFHFLPRIAHILDLVAADGSTVEVAKAASELKETFQHCLEMLDALPGASLTRDDQRRQLAELTATLKSKREQLASYAALVELQWTTAEDEDVQATGDQEHKASGESDVLDMEAMDVEAMDVEPAAPPAEIKDAAIDTEATVEVHVNVDDEDEDEEVDIDGL